jgi:hypothetical protein
MMTKIPAKPRMQEQQAEINQLRAGLAGVFFGGLSSSGATDPPKCDNGFCGKSGPCPALPVLKP